MIYIVFFGLIFILLGSAYMVAVSKYPGYILISIGDYAIEFNFWFLLTAMVLVALALGLFLAFARYILSSFGVSYSWLKNNNYMRHVSKSQLGLVHFAEGDWLRAKKELLLSSKRDQNPLLYYVLAAKCATNLGDIHEAKRLLELAKNDHKVPQDSISIALVNAGVHLLEKKYQACLDILNALPSSVENNSGYLEMKKRAYMGLEDWNGLSFMLPQLGDSGLYDKEKFWALKIMIYSALLDADVANCDGSKEALEACWQKIPKDLKRTGEMLGLYCTALNRVKLDETAASLVQKFLKSTWHRGLVALYGKFVLDDPTAQLALAEKWLAKHQDDATLLCALARISQRSQLWGKARAYYEACLNLEERPEVYAELGALMARLGDHDKSQLLYQKGLSLQIA